MTTWRHGTRTCCNNCNMPGAARCVPTRACTHASCNTRLHPRLVQHQNDEQIRDENQFLKDDIQSLKDRISALVSEHEVVAAGGGWWQLAAEQRVRV
jgi:hypothetical protein